MKSVPVIVVQLVHILGPMKGEIQEFTRTPILIGRDPSCNLRFPPALNTISRKHARITREGNQFRLIDQSANGTFVNGKRIEETVLRNGDVLEFTEGGPKVSFLFEIREGTVEAETVPPPETEESAPAVTPQGQEPPVKEHRQQERPVAAAGPESVQPEPVVEPPPQPSAERVSAPLIIQYGPTLRSYRELPVNIGRDTTCDFIIDHPMIYERHAQIFFSENQYWIKDLTGRQPLLINGQPVAMQSPLNVNDELSLSAEGPVFRFLGEGRLAEVEKAPAAALTPQPPQEETKEEKPDHGGIPAYSAPKKLLSRLKEYWEHKKP
ncbi:MAG: FHA domain-containing protein [Deferribacteres bacterium]|nr:FHA domain-containing protein [Deferribacteres bacterium]